MASSSATAELWDAIAAEAAAESPLWAEALRAPGERDLEPVRELAELISLCAHLRADGLEGDGDAWAATCARLGEGEPDATLVSAALAAHARRVG